MKRNYRNLRSYLIVGVIGCFSALVFLQSGLFVSSPDKILSNKNCSLELDFKQRFWNKELNNISQFSCFGPDKNKSIFSYFVPENFKEVKCLKRKTDFAKENMTQIALASFPGSGNTWYRHLIEDITGIATGSRYNSSLLSHTFIGELKTDTSKTIVIKTHRKAVHFSQSKYYEKAILIFRNPFDAILAEFNRERAGKRAIVNKSVFNSTEWTAFALKKSVKWRKFTMSWLHTWGGPLHISYYERMKSDFYEELYRLISFLGVKVTFRDMWCSGTNREGQYRRQKPSWLKPSAVYSLELQTIINRHLDQVLNYINTNYMNPDLNHTMTKPG